MLRSKLLLAVLILAIGMLLTGCNISVLGEDVEFEVDDEIERSSEDITLEDLTAVRADIYDTVGSVSVEYSEDSSVTVAVKYKVTGDREKELEEILELVKVDVIVEADVLKVDVINKITGENMWDYIEDEYGGLDKPNLDVDLEIELPTTVQEFDIKCDVGNIDIDSLTGKFDINNNVGNVKASNINFTGDSSIAVDVGDISCKLSKDLLEKTEVSLTVNVGGIRIDTEGLPYSSENTGGDNFVGTSETILVKEVCSIDASISVGKLNLR